MADLSVDEKAKRLVLAFDATAEIEASTNLLKGLLPDDVDSLPLKAMVRRIHALNSVIMSIVSGEDDRATSEMNGVVHG